MLQCVRLHSLHCRNSTSVAICSDSQAALVLWAVLFCHSRFSVSVSVTLSFSRLPRALPSCLQQSSADVSTCHAEAVIVFRIVRRRGEDRRQSEFDVHCWLSWKLRLSLLRCCSTSSGTPVSSLSLLPVREPGRSLVILERRRVVNWCRELPVREPGRPLVNPRATT